MNYELAKQLKDAGFPQDLKRGYTASPKMPIGTSLEIIRLAEHAYFPTLEELIEACGSVDLQVRTNTSRATQIGKKPMTLIHGEGSTPTEAVARLYLQLKSA